MEILNTILSSCINGKKKTQVMYRANLSYQQLCVYLELLTSMGLLTVENVDGEKRYVTTEKGLSFLKYFKEINSLLQKPQPKVGARPPPIFCVEQE